MSEKIKEEKIKAHRRRGMKPKKFDPFSIYMRNRVRYYYRLQKRYISVDEFNKLMDINLEEYHKTKKDKRLNEYIGEEL